GAGGPWEAHAGPGPGRSGLVPFAVPVGDVHRGLLRGCGPAVDADVLGPRLLLGVLPHALVVGDEAARALVADLGVPEPVPLRRPRRSSSPRPPPRMRPRVRC